MNLKEKPDEEFNSVAAKLKRAQDHIARLQRENAYLKCENRKLEKKYCDALRKAGVYRKWLELSGGLEKMKDETLPSSGDGSRET